MWIGLVQAIQALYQNSSSAVPLNGQLWEFFKTTVGVHQGCLLSSILFNLFLGKIMQETLHDHHTLISNGQTKQDLAVQHRQLCKHVQALQVSCCLHPPPTPWL